MQEYRRRIVQGVLAEQAANSILCLGESASALLPAELAHTYLDTRRWLQDPHFNERHDLALFLPDTGMHSEEVQHLLVAARDLLARRVLAFLPEPAQVAIPSPYIALGYQRLARLAHDESAWIFAIHSYKNTPDWLNSRYWAHPENFDRHRW